MEDDIYQLHLDAGRICGRERTCGVKRPFDDEAAAQKAALAHNAWVRRKHDVEPYPCPFCGKWHIGRVMSPTELQAIIAGADAAPT
jgi:hypothetical protein